MNKRQRKKHGVAKLPGRRRVDCAVTKSCGNVFRDLGLSDPDRLLEEAKRKSIDDREADESQG